MSVRLPRKMFDRGVQEDANAFLWQALPLIAQSSYITRTGDLVIRGYGTGIGPIPTEDPDYDQQAVPDSPSIGDIWIERDGSNNIVGIWQWNGTNWVTALTQTREGSLVNQAGTTVIDYSTVNTISFDGAIEPTDPVTGNLWFERDGNGFLKNTWIWTGSAWVSLTEDIVITGSYNRSASFYQVENDFTSYPGGSLQEGIYVSDAKGMFILDTGADVTNYWTALVTIEMHSEAGVPTGYYDFAGSAEVLDTSGLTYYNLSTPLYLPASGLTVGTAWTRVGYHLIKSGTAPNIIAYNMRTHLRRTRSL